MCLIVGEQFKDLYLDLKDGTKLCAVNQMNLNKT